MEHPEHHGADDEILIRRFVESEDRYAFRALIERHIGSIRKILYLLFKGCIEDIEDAEQEILLSLYLELKNFRFQSSFKTYLYRLCRNRAIDILRKQNRERNKRKRISMKASSIEPVKPEDKVLTEDCREGISKALFKLGADERMLILMRHIDGFSIRKICSILKSPEGTVKSRLHRSREKLAKELQMEGLKP